jgi:hypothetical protein
MIINYRWKQASIRKNQNVISPVSRFSIQPDSGFSAPRSIVWSKGVENHKKHKQNRELP